MEGLILLPLIGLMVWLMVVPQRRQLKAHRALLAALEEGDAVVTSSGIHGLVTEIDGDVVYLEVAEGIELKLSKSAVARRVNETAEATSEGP